MDLFTVHFSLIKCRVFMFLLCFTVGAFVTCLWDVPVDFFRPQKSSPCSCSQCLTEGDPWFKDLINASPEPFLSRTHKTSEEEFTWWKQIQLEARNFTFFNSTVDDLFKVFPPVPDVVKSSPDRCRTCAVVGNSANLDGSHYGPLIDLHEIVIRMNGGRTKGYESDVGAKTTHHVMYPESAVNLDNNTHLVLFPFKIKDLLWLLQKFDPGNSRVNSRKIANKDLVMILNPAFMKYVHENWLGHKGRYPSTGFMALILSMQLCDEVNVFGFGADSDGNWSHYFEKLTNKRLHTGPHAGNLEYEFIRQLHKIKKIYLY
ncbi:CMP-N-acetylneuraminate-beta-galactosamide-alpha-2,3-sialyltransferase 1-like [Betta splendens]|uniref:CMP-N-acetylneuraminate-beta-galactosamide-alpha-2,3-sialyltransferase 1 n=1 Tax=Betta splendens TaxID=158456 RepID=A0A6P7NXI2_BETSP|nr:CMP-N-acetylneuraminate-beta-galactosamide-alpha-2,3-sialyltransferase 1-like [Betta splendens]XP_029022693.1 CMP-N-acetylneuraminate-beta-galactosamide-alpha-2,3-sialyltransferase 1-like [Betta splendens]